jgi:signal transduction histidine kinase
MNPFMGSKRPLFFVAVAIILTYSLFFYLQSLHEKNLSERLLQIGKDRQELLARSITQNVGADLDSSLQRIKALAETPFFSDKGSNYSLAKQMFEVFQDIRNIAPLDELFLVYPNYTMVKLAGSNNSMSIVALRPESVDTVFTNFIGKSLTEKRSLFSPGYFSDGKWRIAITTPIFDLDTGKNIGLVGVSIPSLDLVSRYGNVLDPTKQRLVFYDKNATLLAGYPLPKSMIGHSMFSPENQKIIPEKERPTVNDLFHRVLSEQIITEEFDLGDGERLVTGHPIVANGSSVYYLNIPTPFNQILSPIQSLLHTELVLNIFLLGAFTAAIVYLVWNLSRWGSRLRFEVDKRTQELDFANKSLQSTAVKLQEKNKELYIVNNELIIANEALKLHDKIQREFVNVAAHELRTPVQAIIGYAEMLNVSEERNREYERTLLRNANRLHKLSSDILDVARIDSETLKLEKSKFDIIQKILNVIQDVREASSKEIKRKGLEIVFEARGPIMVYADKPRIFQVLSNLLSNAIKFTDTGNIVITAEKNLANHRAVVTVRDTGIGISRDMLPNLFSRFMAKSDTGTGLGLFIAKSIVEAHGGDIGAFNNASGRGATFTFSIPLVE